VKLFGGNKIGNLIFWLPLVWSKIKPSKTVKTIRDHVCLRTYSFETVAPVARDPRFLFPIYVRVATPYSWYCCPTCLHSDIKIFVGIYQQATWDELRGHEERTKLRRAEWKGGERERERLEGRKWRREQYFRFIILALQEYKNRVGFGLPNSFLPCFSTTVILLQFWILVFLTSNLTSSAHLNLGRPILTTTTGVQCHCFHSPFWINPYNMPSPSYALCFYIHRTISTCLISKYISSLVLILQLPSWFFIWPCIFLIIYCIHS
jgi:hypothetical protein